MIESDVVIIGAGASGFICAIESIKRGKDTIILEHNPSPLKKVEISGGGKCNFTNLYSTEKKYLSKNDFFIKNVLTRFSPEDFLDLIKKHNIKYIEKSTGQFFTKNGANEIIKMLKKESEKAKIICNTKIENIEKDQEFFYIKTNLETYKTKSLVVATGGMSYQNLGASDLGYKIAKQFNIKIIPYKPALVPFNLDSKIMVEVKKLQGISLNSKISCGQKTFEDGLLFTHFGLSGPAILQTSLYWQKGEEITINLLPKIDINTELKNLRNQSKSKKIINILSSYIPQKLAEYIIKERDIFISEASNILIEEIAKDINSWKIVPVGTQGYKMAEATSGGIDVDEIEQRTMESKKIKGLYFIGEVLDVTGEVGGFNLQWAWSSGFVAGKSA